MYIENVIDLNFCLCFYIPKKVPESNKYGKEYKKTKVKNTKNIKIQIIVTILNISLKPFLLKFVIFTF